MKNLYLICLTILLSTTIGFSQLVWEMSNTISPVSSYRGATAGYFSGDQHYLFVFGGWTTSSGIFKETSIYNFEDDTWTAGSIIPENTKGGSAVCINDDIYLLIGNNGEDNNINSNIFLKYNITSEIWEYMAEYPFAARYVAMTYNPLNGMIYCAGGLGDDYATVNKVIAYNPEANSWTSCTSIPFVSSGGSALVCEGNHLYLIGGLINEPFNKLFKGLIDNYDPNNIVWTPGSSIPVEMNKLSAGYIGNGQIMATDLNGTFTYDISDDSWSVTEDKPTLVKGGNYISIEIDNKYNFAIAGGKDASANFVDHVEFISGDENIKFPATFVLTTAAGEPVENAEILVSSYTIYTDEAGSAVQYLENGTYDYIAHYGNLEASGSFTIDGAAVYIENQLLVSIHENLINFSIYPNPSNGIIVINMDNFEADNLSFDISITDMLGKQIYVSSIDNFGNHVLNISGFEKGTYFLTLSDSKNNKTMKKLVIN